MRLFVFAGFFALVLGGYFHEDIAIYLKSEFGGRQQSSSVGNLGGAVRNNFGYVGGSLGH